MAPPHILKMKEIFMHDTKRFGGINSKRSASLAPIIPVIAVLLTGCASPNDSSRIGGQQNSMANVGQSLNAGINNTLSSLRDSMEQMAKANKDKVEADQKGPPGLRIKDTQLAGLFKKYPIDGTKKAPRYKGDLWFPRVALIPISIPSAHWKGWGDTASYQTIRSGNNTGIAMRPGGDRHNLANMCWVYTAKIWSAPTKHTDVPEFLYCASEAAPGVRIGGTPPTTVLGGPLISSTQSGSLFTSGPRQPMQFASKKYFHDNDEISATYGVEAMLGLLTAMGIDPYDDNEGNRVWVADSSFAIKDF